jgi:hypothetical protein
MKKYWALVVLLILFIQASAYNLEYGDNVTINQPVYENLYVAGGTITINAPIHGDLICTGGTISINDSVMNDILIAGGNVTFNGYAGGDIRCAGGQLFIQKSMNGDLVIGGGQVTVNKDVMIGGGLMIGGGDISFNGTVKKSVKVGAGKLSFNGVAEQDVDMRCSEITINGSIYGKSVLAAKNIYIGNNASFNDNIRYWNEKGSLDFKSTIKKGTAVYDDSLKMQTGRWYYLGGITVLGLLWYIGMALLMIGIIQYLFSATMKKSGDTAFNYTLKSLGFGFLFFIAVPVAAVVAFLTIIGVPVGLLLIFNYVVLILLATVISSVVADNWMNNRFNYKWNYWRLVFAALGAFVVMKLLSFTPFLGWFIMLVIVCIAFGAVLINIKWRKEKQATVAAE